MRCCHHASCQIRGAAEQDDFGLDSLILGDHQATLASGSQDEACLLRQWTTQTGHDPTEGVLAEV